MKKIFSFLLIALSVSFIYSCTSGTGETYTIKMRLNKGDTFGQDMQMNMKMNTAGIDMNMKVNTVYGFDVLTTSDSGSDIKVTYKKMNVNMDMGKLNSTIPDSIKNKQYDNLVGQSVVFKLSKENEITDVTGFDELMNDPKRDSATREMMKQMLSKDQFNNMFGMMFSMYPKKPVKVGETWVGETRANMANMDMKISNKYKLLAVNNGLAEISIDGTIGMAGEIMKTTGVKMDMTGTQKGKIIIRMDNGYLHNSSYEMDIKAEMQMMGQKMPMTMKATYTVKGL